MTIDTKIIRNLSEYSVRRLEYSAGKRRLQSANAPMDYPGPLTILPALTEFIRASDALTDWHAYGDSGRYFGGEPCGHEERLDHAYKTALGNLQRTVGFDSHREYYIKNLIRGLKDDKPTDNPARSRLP